MSRLTKTMREAIASNAVCKSGHKQRFLDACKALRDWADLVRIDSLGGRQKEGELLTLEARIVEMLLTVPSDLLHTSNPFCYVSGNIRVNVAGKSVLGTLDKPGLGKYRHTLGFGHPLTDHWQALQNEMDDAEKAQSDAYQTVLGTLEQFTTIKSLLDAWPEALELLPEIAAPAAKMPVIQVADLNKLIGLPSGK